MSADAKLPIKSSYSLKMLFSVLGVSCTLLLAVILVALVQVDKVNKRLSDVHVNRYSSYLLADELRQSSDDLTRFARTYVVTGDERYERQYQEVLDIRNGKKPRPDGEAAPLEDLMRHAGFAEQELALLQKAQQNSDALVQAEVKAMNAMKGRFADGQGGYAKQGKPDLEMARRLMFDKTYQLSKVQIMAPIDEFFVSLDNRTKGNVEQAMQESRRAFFVLIGVGIFSLILFNAALLFVYRQIFKDLGAEPSYARLKVEEIAAGDLTQAIDLRPKDESSLLFAMNVMKNNLSLLIGRITDNASQLASVSDDLAIIAGVALQDERQARFSVRESQSIAATVAAVSASVTEITSTMEELSSSAIQIADNSQSVVTVAEKTLQSSQNGVEAMQDLLNRIINIRDDNQKNLAEVVALGNKSKEISKVMDIINTLADQTKLIAFNASIEASSAGDAGKRFSVVAGEIRTLADSVTRSTFEIENKINQIQEAINRLVNDAEKGQTMIESGMNAGASTAGELDAIRSTAGQTSDSARQISISIQHQKIANAQVVQALREIVSASVQTSRMADSLSNTSQTLIAMSQQLRQDVQKFKLPV